MKGHLMCLICICLMAPVVQSAEKDLDPRAVRAKEDLSDKLRSLKAYTVDTKVRTRAAVGPGRYRDFSGRVQYVVAGPQHLRADIESKSLVRRVYYDGSVLTVYAPSERMYARVPVPGDLGTLAQEIKKLKGVELPISRIFSWDESAWQASGMSRALYSGKRPIAGRTCDHYSYKIDNVSWEIWVGEDDLPCKIVMVDIADRGLPGYSAEFTWNLKPQGSVTDFTFTPPQGVREVALSEIPES